MVRVLVVADEEAGNLRAGAVRSLDPELILSAGDLPWDYLEELASAVEVPVLFVPGNHDPELDRPGRGHRARPHGARCVDGAVLSAAGLRVAGLGGCVRYRAGPHQYTQQQYAVLARRLLRRVSPEGPVDVLLTHAPPLGVGDGDDDAHQGIAALHGVLDRLQPTWHLHGHIHPYTGRTPDRLVGTTTVRNVVPWTMLDIEPKRPPGPDGR